MNYCTTFDAWKLGTFDIVLTGEDASICYHSGSCDDDCENAIMQGYIRNQLSEISDEQIQRVLEDYGVDDVTEKSRKELEMFIVWLAAGNIVDGDCSVWEGSLSPDKLIPQSEGQTVDLLCDLLYN